MVSSAWPTNQKLEATGEAQGLGVKPDPRSPPCTPVRLGERQDRGVQLIVSMVEHVTDPDATVTLTGPGGADLGGSTNICAYPDPSECHEWLTDPLA